ncbi:hypothetical protein Pfo_017388 [Paulownia fortunei]|nr:hypothetical protein Pfo_017388 [Paulownia fortunei]
MAVVRNNVSYCCVSKGGGVLYTYNSGDHEIENLATLCLERAPPYHQWYFQTMGKKTFGFLMDDGYVYFAIVNESLGNLRVLRFLQKLRKEFRKVEKRVSTRSVSSPNSPCLQEQLLPVVRHLVASLDHASGTDTEWHAENPSPNEGELTLPPGKYANGHSEGGASTRAPLLGKPIKQEQRILKDHVISLRDIEMEEHRRLTDREVKIDSGALDPEGQGAAASPLREDFNTSRIKPSSQNLQKKWCRQVRIILAIDFAVCVVLLIIWLVICHGYKKMIEVASNQPVEANDGPRHVLGLGAFFGELTVEDDAASDDVSLEGLEQELQDCITDDLCIQQVVAMILSKGTKLRDYTKDVEDNPRITLKKLTI